ncbi:MAG TPA: CVNH domain-containing protein [Candidatus Angelobacter sp.]|nr:CVNH domain-containing protein [Candidatus Angelobacter sp.]
MRYPIMLGTITLVMLLGIGKSNAAAWDNPPRGSYQSSCKNIKVRGDVLYARCKNYDNHWVDTQLNDYDRCGGDISNTGGQLTCGGGGQGGGSYPSGDYTQTCRDISVRGNTLRARCQTGNGDWNDAYLDSYDRCRNGISNINGQLRCNGSGDGDRDYDRGRGRAPRGSYSQTCRDIGVRGDTLYAECDTGNGDWRRASLNHYDDCSGEIVNDNGQLDCTHRGGRQVPRGTYSQTCRNIYVRGDKLRASCQTGDGGWNWSQLDDWDDCRGGIVNDRGHLVCRKDRDRD